MNKNQLNSDTKINELAFSAISAALTLVVPGIRGASPRCGPGSVSGGERAA